MRTKTLVIAAAIAAVGAATSMAQVFSVNVVGYVNVTVPAGKYKIIANQLNNGGNTIEQVISNAPGGFIVYAYNNATQSFLINGYDADFGWDDPAMVVAPGMGLFVRAPAGANANITFVGEVPQGTLNTPVGRNFSLLASQVPQAGRLQTDLGFTPQVGDIVYRYRNDRYLVSNFDEFGWDEEPALEVGEGFYMFRSGNAGTWTRTFNVN
jgi:hypothetical protein